MFFMVEEILTPCPNLKSEEQFSNRVSRIVKLLTFKVRLAFEIVKFKNP